MFGHHGRDVRLAGAHELALCFQPIFAADSVSPPPQMMTFFVWTTWAQRKSLLYEKCAMRSSGALGLLDSSKFLLRGPPRSSLSPLEFEFDTTLCGPKYREVCIENIIIMIRLIKNLHLDLAYVRRVRLERHDWYGTVLGKVVCLEM